MSAPASPAHPSPSADLSAASQIAIHQDTRVFVDAEDDPGEWRADRARRSSAARPDTRVLSPDLPFANITTLTFLAESDTGDGEADVKAEACIR
jgi:hypothetical protein